MWRLETPKKYFNFGGCAVWQTGQQRSERALNHKKTTKSQKLEFRPSFACLFTKMSLSEELGTLGKGGSTFTLKESTSHDKVTANQKQSSISLGLATRAFYVLFKKVLFNRHFSILGKLTHMWHRKGLKYVVDFII